MDGRKRRTNQQAKRTLQVLRWGIYQVDDELLRLPPDSEQRGLHMHRYFVVISNTEVCSSVGLDFVLGCPTSTDPNHVIEPWDVRLPDGICGTEDGCWVRIPALQPLDKKHLVDRRTGEVPGDLRRTIAENIFDFMELDV